MTNARCLLYGVCFFLFTSHSLSRNIGLCWREKTSSTPIPFLCKKNRFGIYDKLFVLKAFIVFVCFIYAFKEDVKSKLLNFGIKGKKRVVATERNHVGRDREKLNKVRQLNQLLVKHNQHFELFGKQRGNKNVNEFCVNSAKYSHNRKLHFDSADASNLACFSCQSDFLFVMRTLNS